MSSNQKGVASIVILVGILVIITSYGYFVYSNSSKTGTKSQNLIVISPTPSPTPSLIMQPTPSQTPNLNLGPSHTLDDTANWKTFDSKVLFKPIVAYSFKYPDYWEYTYSVFWDNSDNRVKVAEPAPGITLLSANQACLDIRLYVRGEIIEQTRVKIGTIESLKTIQKGEFEGKSLNGNNVWYPHTYCITYGDKAFTMTFFEYKQPFAKEGVFETIISTFKFTD